MSYDIIINKKNEKYIFYVKELSLIHISENLEEGFNETETKKENIINSLKNNNIAIPKINKKENEIIQKKIGIFAIKSLIISGAITLVVCFSLITFFKNFNQSVNNFKIKTGREFWGQLEKNIIDLGKEENQIKKETQDKAINSIKILVKRYKPYIKEASKIFDD